MTEPAAFLADRIDRRLWTWRWPIAFGLVMVLALGLRLDRVDVGHEDEVYTIGFSMKMLYTGDLNPEFFQYPTGGIYLALLADVVALAQISRETSNGHVGEGGTPPLQRLKQAFPAIEEGWLYRSHDHELLTPFLVKARTVFLAFIPLQILLLAYIGWKLNLLTPAWLAALFLAVSPASVIDSSYVAVNVPAGTFVLLAAALMTFFATRPGPLTAWRLWSEVFWIGLVCGLATSCKYNAGVSLLLPWLYAAFMLVRFAVPAKPETWVVSVLCAGAGLLIGFTMLTPYWFPELSMFLEDVLYEVWHNRTGHAAWNTMEPGSQMLWYNTLAVTDQVSWTALVLGAGAVGVLGLDVWERGWRWSSATCALLPMVVMVAAFFALMSNQAVFFIRNFSIVWPLLFLGLTTSWWLALGVLAERFSSAWLMRFRGPILLGIALLCLVHALWLDPLLFPREWWREWWAV